MTRAEEIEKEAHRVSHNGDEFNSFIQGAEWSDKTMIEKACNWIKERIMIPYEGKFDGNQPILTDYLAWCEDRLKEAERIVNEFKKAMES